MQSEIKLLECESAPVGLPAPVGLWQLADLEVIELVGIRTFLQIISNF